MMMEFKVWNRIDGQWNDEEYFLDKECNVHFINGRGRLEALPVGMYAVEWNTGFVDKDGTPIFTNDLVELVVDGEVRTFRVVVGAVNRKVKNHYSFANNYSLVLIKGIMFEWQENEFYLFPCVDENGLPDTCRMKVVGNVHD